jgi:hypothetical protein
MSRNRKQNVETLLGAKTIDGLFQAYVNAMRKSKPRQVLVRHPNNTMHIGENQWRKTLSNTYNKRANEIRFSNAKKAFAAAQVKARPQFGPNTRYTAAQKNFVRVQREVDNARLRNGRVSKALAKKLNKARNERHAALVNQRIKSLSNGPRWRFTRP